MRIEGNGSTWFYLQQSKKVQPISKSSKSKNDLKKDKEPKKKK